MLSEKVCIRDIRPALFSGVRSMVRPGVFLLTPPQKGCWCITGLASILNPCSYTLMERGSVRVNWLAQEYYTVSPARVQTWTARSGGERTNLTAAPPILFFSARFCKLDINCIWTHSSGIFFEYRQSIKFCQKFQASNYLLLVSKKCSNFFFCYRFFTKDSYFTSSMDEMKTSQAG